MKGSAHTGSLLIGMLLPVGAWAASAGAVAPHPDWRNALAPEGRPGPRLVLAQGGEARYRIVLPVEPSTQEEMAAEELARWLKAMSGAAFEVVREVTGFRPDGREISLGRTRLLADSPLESKEADLGNEGYAIDVQGETLYLFGGAWRGPIYAVFALLEEDLGCRWYARGTATIPRRRTLAFRPVPRTYVPPLERRDPYYSDAHDPVWSLRNRTNSHRVAIPAKWGGHAKSAYFFVHSYNIIMPPAEFFADHPEYFAEIDGVRTDRQLCPTHPDVQRIFAERALAHLAGCSDCRYVDVSPNDWRDYCECAACRALDEVEGGYAASMLQLVNAVADAVAEVRPDVKVTTLAYLGTFMPPRTVRPRDNVQVVLCTDTHAWEFLQLPVTDTQQFHAALRAWSEIGARFIVWDYVVDFFRYMAPLPNLAVAHDNLRDFVRHGAEGVFMQGSHGGNLGIDRAQLRCWVFAKLLWNPDLELEALVRDFYLGFYGPAAEPLLEYDAMLAATWRDQYAEWRRRYPEPLTPTFAQYQEVFFPRCAEHQPKVYEDYAGMISRGHLAGCTGFDDAFFSRARELFVRAHGAAGDDRELRRRVEYATLPFLYLQAERGPSWEPYDPEPYLVLLSEFERIARRERAVFTREAYAGPDLDRRLREWRALAAIDPHKVHSQPLSNVWKFRPDPEVVGIEEGWHTPEHDDSAWGTVRSDLGHRGWESQGYAEYEVGYGWYRQRFPVPDDLDDLENLRLFFPGVDEQAEIWLNGRHALSHTTEALRMSKDLLWKTPFQFDPKAFLRAGEENLLAVRVHNDLHVGGIYRPVRLFWGEPPIEDLRALDDLLSRRERGHTGDAGRGD